MRKYNFKEVIDATKDTIFNFSRQAIGDNEVADLVVAFQQAKREITHLDLSHNKIGDKGSQSLSNLLISMKGLIELNLSCNTIGDSGTQDLCQVIKSHKQLIQFNLSNNQIGDKGVQSLAEVLKSNKEIAQLDLSKNQIGKEGVGHLGDLLKKNKGVTQLNLSSNKIGDEGAKSLSDILAENKGITHLELVSCDLGNEGVKFLSESLKANKKITHLNMMSNDIGDEGAKYLAQMLESNKYLTHIDFSKNKIGDEGAELLGKAMKSKKNSISHINLSFNLIGGSGVAALAEAMTKKKRIEIDLSRNKINEDGACSIAKALKSKKTVNLKILLLRSNEIGDFGAREIISSLNENIGLVEIDLSWNNIGPMGLKNLKDLKFNGTLKKLDLGKNNIADQGCEFIKEGLKEIKSLDEIKLNHNEIGNKGATAIAQGLESNEGLRKIDLSYNNIEDSGAESIYESLKKNQFLSEIDLKNNNIGTKGVKNFAVQDFKKAITYIDLRGNNYDPAEVRNLPQNLKFFNRKRNDPNRIIEEETKMMAPLKKKPSEKISNSKEKSKSEIQLQSKSEEHTKKNFHDYLNEKKIELIPFDLLNFSRDEANFLGRGAFGKVFRGTYIDYEVAIKEYHDINIYDQHSEDEGRSENYSLFLNEISHAISLNLPGFNKFFGVSISVKGGLYTVHELADRSLKNLLENNKDMTLYDKHLITKQILAILGLLQHKKAVHGDLKPANFLMIGNKVQICDFGAVTQLNNEIILSNKNQFTARYAPPEFIDSESTEIGFNSDIWSLCIIIYEIYYGKHFWNDLLQEEVKDNLKNMSIPKAEEKKGVPLWITNIINEGLVYEGKNRIILAKITKTFKEEWQKK